MSDDESAPRKDRGGKDARYKARKKAGIPTVNGGHRAGAGRKAGTLNKRSEANIEKAEKSGIMPLDLMLAEMRGYYDQVQRERAKHRPDKKLVKEFAAAAIACAKDAAPYLHPKLQAIAHSGNVAMTHEQWLERM